MDSRVRSAIVIAALLACATPALAQEACVEPAAPAPISGTAVTGDQLRAAMADARGFITQSNIFQECLHHELEAARTQAGTEGHPLDPVLETSVKTRIAASQQAQDKVSQTVNTALTTYKQVHPN